jgi:hypothetical protein
MVNFTLEREQIETMLSVYPLVATGEYLMNFTFSLSEKGDGFVFNSFTVFYVKGYAMTTGW